MKLVRALVISNMENTLEQDTQKLFKSALPLGKIKNAKLDKLENLIFSVIIKLVRKQVTGNMQKYFAQDK